MITQLKGTVFWYMYLPKAGNAFNSSTMSCKSVIKAAMTIPAMQPHPRPLYKQYHVTMSYAYNISHDHTSGLLGCTSCRESRDHERVSGSEAVCDSDDQGQWGWDEGPSHGQRDGERPQHHVHCTYLHTV